MPEVTYNILNLEKPISDKGLIEVIKEFDGKEIDVQNTRLSEEQLKIFMTTLFVYGMHYDAVDNGKRTLFLRAATEERFPLLAIPKKFCLHLLNNLEASAQLEFGLIQKMEHNLSFPFSNDRLLDFVEMELMDVTESYRKWEYGRFAVENISEHLFMDKQWDKAKKAIEKDASKIEEYLQEFEKLIGEKGRSLKLHEKLFLQLLVKAELHPESANMADYLMMGTIFQRKIFDLSLRIDKLIKTLDSTIKASKYRQKGKGGPRL